jgi:hypothetical protein
LGIFFGGGLYNNFHTGLADIWDRHLSIDELSQREDLCSGDRRKFSCS